MADTTRELNTTGGPRPTLGLTGVTVNAMALIAPGAFLWGTYQIQASTNAPDGTSTSADIWAGVIFALIVAFLTAFSYSALAARYPEAGFGSSYYFAEKAFLDKSNKNHHRWARLAKLVTGWAAHLFYWVYPGIMVAFMVNIITYIYGQMTGNSIDFKVQVIIGLIFAIVTGYIAMRGINGSTMTALAINVIQLVSLVVFSILALVYRINNPQGATSWTFTSVTDVVKPHSISGVLIQATVAILILVGFESCTSLAAETKDPKRHIPKGIILSLVIQGIFAYTLEYFSANYMLSEKLTSAGTDANGKAITLTGMDAAAASGAPIGDLAILLGQSVIPAVGTGLMYTIAITVAIAILGTTLSCMNTAVRVSYAMAQDNEMPEILNVMHGKFATPHRAIWVLVAFATIIGAVGTYTSTGLLGITLASDFGTFVLYSLICIWTIITFWGTAEFSVLKHLLVPGLGLIANIVMLAAIIYLAIAGGGNSQQAAFICFGIAGAWALLTIVYVVYNSISSGRSIIVKPGSSVERSS